MPQLNVDLADVAYQVSIGLIGAGVLTTGAFVFRMARGAILNRRFPVAGLYRSTFEDIEDGKKVLTKAVAELHQRGRRIWGPTYEVGSNRRWQLEGYLDSSGRIHGRYTADDPHDVGLGAFFLELHSNHTLEGMWTGYDSENKTVSAGRYFFRRIDKAATRPMTSADVPSALSILGNALGARYISREELNEYAEHHEKLAYVAMVPPTGKIVAAATGVIPPNPSDLLDIIPADQRSVIAELVPELEYNLTGLLKSVAVDPHARGGGVGTEVSSAVVQAMFDRGATGVISIGWTDKDGCHIEGPLKTLGFTERGEIQDFWRSDSIEQEYSCPTCGRPCRCTAKIFVLSVAAATKVWEYTKQGESPWYAGVIGALSRSSR